MLLTRSFLWSVTGNVCPGGGNRLHRQIPLYGTVRPNRKCRLAQIESFPDPTIHELHQIQNLKKEICNLNPDRLPERGLNSVGQDILCIFLIY